MARKGGARADTTRAGGALPKARKRFGQHFLRDASVLDAIVEALGPLEGRTVVEIGPGRGVLTDRLVERAARVIAIELDRDLAAHLRVRYALQPHVEIVEADVLSVSIGALAGTPYVLAGNVPYYITTPILFHALESPRPDVAVYLVQREVAERMSAPPGDKTYGALSVNLQALSRVEFIRHVPPGAFAPPPKVDSAVVRVLPRDERVIAPELERRFRGVVTSAFGLRRKQLLRVVRTIASLDADAAEAVLERAGLPGDVRPETLSPEDFARLVRALPHTSPTEP
ncbi:MAG: 16S rRNA (adenine(1518)-N(6)/adenine(1519)-N(6))-dimethyltransferase RsmA [Gemmatimonadota bacterium]